MRKRALLIFVIAEIVAPLVLSAQANLGSPLSLRYQYGDNAAWSQTQFADDAWPVSQDGKLSPPGYDSDGFYWVRSEIAVPAEAADPLAIEAQISGAAPRVREVWVNGRLVGRYGEFPPQARPRVSPRMLVLDIPAGVVQPGQTAVIALRIWNAPDDWNSSLLRRHPDPVNVRLSIGSAPLQHAVAAHAQDRSWMLYWPRLTVALIFMLLGLAVLALGIWAKERQLLLCALWLVALPAYLTFAPLQTLLTGVSTSTVRIIFLLLNAVGMYVVVEFTWAVQGFRNRFFRAVLHICWIGLTISLILAATEMHPGALASAEILAGNWLLFLFNVIGTAASLIALMGWGRNRAVAGAMLLISVGYFLGLAGEAVRIVWLGLSLFTWAFYVCTLVIAALLMHQTWKAWRKAESMRIEFAAARELQRQLVPTTLPTIAGWRMEAAYLPAAEVGGDFYHVIEHAGGTVLLVGDVSGKGLKAAMTGLLTIGAASAVAAECTDPAQLLSRLNREMIRLQKGGFITCLCAVIGADGAVTLANAGHLAPYRNGEELKLDSSLPLGITSNVEYSETMVQLGPGDRFTFLSDGVVEAQSASGELFGFDRTRAISGQSAGQIAQAAQAFGQEDDITVLTLTFSPAEILPG